MNQSSPLPNFASPPVVEVALSIQFDPLQSLRVPQIGLLWGKYRDRFSSYQEHPPLDSAFEIFGLHPPDPDAIRIEVSHVLPLPRIWLLNENQTKLIQIQNDRFIHNWRKVGTHEEYPRYESIRKVFEEEFSIFEEFVNTENLGSIIPNQCEVTYVNHIAIDSYANHGRRIEDILTFVGGNFSDSFLSSPEDIRCHARFIIPNDEGESIGRLHVNARPRFKIGEDERILELTLTARGTPFSNSIDGVLKFLDIGRIWIVRGFASITTTNMHELWERIC